MVKQVLPDHEQDQIKYGVTTCIHVARKRYSLVAFRIIGWLEGDKQAGTMYQSR